MSRKFPSCGQTTHQDGESNGTVDHPVGDGVVVGLPAPENTTENPTVSVKVPETGGSVFKVKSTVNCERAAGLWSPSHKTHETGAERLQRSRDPAPGPFHAHAAAAAPTQCPPGKSSSAPTRTQTQSEFLKRQKRVFMVIHSNKRRTITATSVFVVKICQHLVVKIGIATVPIKIFRLERPI